MWPGLQVRGHCLQDLVLLPVISMSQFQGSRLWVGGQRLCWILSWATLKSLFWPFWPMLNMPGDLQVIQQSCWLYHNQSLSARNSFGKNSHLAVPQQPQQQHYLVYADSRYIMGHSSAPRGWRPRCPSVLLEVGLDVLSI